VNTGEEKPPDRLHPSPPAFVSAPVGTQATGPGPAKAAIQRSDLMFRQIRLLALAAAFAATACAATSVQAGSIIGLVDGKSIVTIDPSTRKVTGVAVIKGTDTAILGIDVRPGDGMVYGIASNGMIYTIDPKSGQSTKKSKLSEAWKAGVTTTIDFNPAADRLRVMGSHGASLRVNVDDGKVTIDGSHKYKDGDPNAGKTPKIVAGAYTNSKKGAPTTTLYNIDAATGALVTQAPPNDGVLNTVGALGITLTEPVAFNIVADGEGNAAWLATGGVLYSVDLRTGKAILAGKIDGLNGKLVDISWID
jgi:hypothetical protein